MNDVTPVVRTLQRELRSLSFLATLAVAAGLFLAGCSGDGQESPSSRPQRSQQPAPQSQQRQSPGQMPKPGGAQMLSSSDVSDEQVQKVARIAFSVQMGVRPDRRKMQKKMKEKYGNPQQMDSTQKARAQKEMRVWQMKMQKKRMKIMQKQAKKEGMTPQMFRKIMRSARRDSTLRTRLRTAMKTYMEEQKPQMQQTPGPQNR